MKFQELKFVNNSTRQITKLGHQSMRFRIICVGLLSIGFLAEGMGVGVEPEELPTNESFFAQSYEELEAETRVEKAVSLSAALPKRNSLRDYLRLREKAPKTKPLNRGMRVRNDKLIEEPSRVILESPLIASEEERYLDNSRKIQGLRRGNLSPGKGKTLLQFVAVDESNGVEDRLDTRSLSLKNDALVCLLEQEPLDPQLGETMLSVVQNPDSDPIWREYVLQYFNRYYRKQWPVGSSSGIDPERQAFQQTLAKALFHEDSGLAGTALIVIEDLAADYPEFQGGILHRAALRVVESSECSVASRITALSILGSAVSDPRCFRIVADLAENPEEPLVIRTTATGQLARMAKSNTRAKEKLQNIAWLTDRHTVKGARLKQVAERHLDKVEARIVMNEIKDLRNENKGRSK